MFIRGALRMDGVEIFANRLSKHRRTWTVAAVIISLVFIILGQLATYTLLLRPWVYTEEGLNHWLVMCLVLLGFGFITLITMAWVTLFERKSLKTMGFNDQFLWRYGRGFIMGLLFIGVTIGVIALLGGYNIKASGVFDRPQLALFYPLLALLIGFIIQGGSEEVVVRGWLMPIIASRHGIILAITMSSLLFAVLHALNAKPSPEFYAGLVNIVLVGVFLGLYAIKEGSLWGVCAWHSAWNWLLGVGFGLEVSGQSLTLTPLVLDLDYKADAPWWLTGRGFGPEGSLIVTAILTLGIIWLVYKKAYVSTKGFGLVAQDVDSEK